MGNLVKPLLLLRWPINKIIIKYIMVLNGPNGIVMFFLWCCNIRNKSTQPDLNYEDLITHPFSPSSEAKQGMKFVVSSFILRNKKRLGWCRDYQHLRSISHSLEYLFSPLICKQLSIFVETRSCSFVYYASSCQMPV